MISPILLLQLFTLLVSLAHNPQGLPAPLLQLFRLVQATPLALTTHNAVVMLAWRTMTGVADAFLGLYILIGAIQVMYGDSVGTLRMPIGQFIGKALLTAMLIHLSAAIGEYLLIFNNLLCGIVQANIQDFIRQVNKGLPFTDIQTTLIDLVITVLFNIGMIRILFQAIKRIIRFNVLFVLSGPAFLTSFHPATTSVFSIWVRMYVVTIFEQFIQYLTFGLGIQFLIATQQTGLTGFLLAAAMLNMTAEIPALLARFSAATGGQRGVNIGTLVSTTVRVAAAFL